MAASTSLVRLGRRRLGQRVGVGHDLGGLAQAGTVRGQRAPESAGVPSLLGRQREQDLRRARAAGLVDVAGQERHERVVRQVGVRVVPVGDQRHGAGVVCGVARAGLEQRSGVEVPADGCSHDEDEEHRDDAANEAHGRTVPPAAGNRAAFGCRGAPGPLRRRTRRPPGRRRRRSARSRSRMARRMRETCIWLTPIRSPISAWVQLLDEAQVQHQALPFAQAGDRAAQRVAHLVGAGVARLDQDVVGQAGAGRRSGRPARSAW